MMRRDDDSGDDDGDDDDEDTDEYGRILTFGLTTSNELAIDTVPVRSLGNDFVGFARARSGWHFMSARERTASGAHVGEFIYVCPRADVMRTWSAEEESLVELNDDRGTRERRASTSEAATRVVAMSREIDAHWRALSAYIDENALERCNAGAGARVCAGDPDWARAGGDSALTPYRKGAPRAPRFTTEATERAPRCASASEVTAINADPEKRLEHAIGCFGADAWRGLLGELQVAFVLLAGLSSLDALEQWKALVNIVCACARDAVKTRPELYSAFIDVIEPQVKRAGSEFFAGDADTENNFLRPCLVALARIDVEEARRELHGSVLDAERDAKLDEVARKLDRFVRFVRAELGVDLVAEARRAKDDDEKSILDAGDDAPVIVELSEGTYMRFDAFADVPVDVVDSSTAAAERMSWMSPPPALSSTSA